MKKKLLISLFFLIGILILFNSKSYASFDEYGNYYEYQGKNDEIKCVIPKIVWDSYNFNLEYYSNIYQQDFSNWYKCLFCYRTGAGSDTDTWAFWVIPPTNDGFFFTYGADTGGFVDTSVRSWNSQGYWIYRKASQITDSTTVWTKANSYNNNSSLNLSVSLSINGFEGYRYPSCRPLYSNKNQLRFDYYQADSVWWKKYPAFTNPSFDNYDNTGLWGDSLITGEFKDFVFTAGDSEEINIIFIDDTYVQYENRVDYYNIELDKSSNYYDDETNSWVIPINDISVPYMNNHSYTLDIIWDNNGVDSVNYEWTTNFSSTVLSDLQANGYNSLNKISNAFSSQELTGDKIQEYFGGLAEVSNTLNTLNDEYLTILFQNLYECFTDNNAENFVFEFPNSNGQTLIIPANYIESHLPFVITNIIRIFYWYMISMYILKDIWKVVDKLRTASFFEKDEVDVKTEAL